ncbi:MAG: hypothetical protein ACKO25_07705 [Cyanobium sp.]
MTQAKVKFSSFLLAIGGAIGGAALSTLGAGSAQAVVVTDPGLVSFEIDCNCSNPIFEGTVGWDFQVIVPHTINLLGVYDADADGLSVATDVGIWDRGSGSLLASATVPAGTLGHLLNQFRYTPIGALTLNPGVTYSLGAQYNQPFNSDWYQLITKNNSFAPWITYLNSTGLSGPSLTLPNDVGLPDFGVYGPNIASVPGPLPILGAAAVFGYSRKLRKLIKASKNEVISTTEV